MMTLSKELKTAAIHSVIMVFLCAFCILGIEISKRPDAEGLCAELEGLAEYSGGEYLTEPSAVYAELYSLGAEGLSVYSVASSAKEFAVCSFEGEAPQEAAEVYKKRLAELGGEFADNAAELDRIGDARIITVNRYAVLVVCDSIDTAENAVYRYFGLG